MKLRPALRSCLVPCSEHWLPSRCGSRRRKLVRGLLVCHPSRISENHPPPRAPELRTVGASRWVTDKQKLPIKSFFPTHCPR